MAEVGETKPPPPEKGFVSVVSRRLVAGLEAEDGDCRLKLLEVPWETDALRPFNPPVWWFVSLFWAACFKAELTSDSNSYTRVSPKDRGPSRNC